MLYVDGRLGLDGEGDQAQDEEEGRVGVLPLGHHSSGRVRASTMQM